MLAPLPWRPSSINSAFYLGQVVAELHSYLRIITANSFEVGYLWLLDQENLTWGKMSELNSIELDSSETIQDIALKLVTEQLKNDSHLKVGPSERTIFVLGSKGAVSD